MEHCPFPPRKNCLVSRLFIQSEHSSVLQQNKKKKRGRKKDQQLPAMLQEEFHMELTKGNRHLKAPFVPWVKEVINASPAGWEQGWLRKAGAAVSLLCQETQEECMTNSVSEQNTLFNGQKTLTFYFFSSSPCFFFFFFFFSIFFFFFNPLKGQRTDLRSLLQPNLLRITWNPGQMHCYVKTK